MKRKTKKPLPKNIYPAHVDVSMTVFCFSFDPEIVKLAADDLARVLVQEANARIQLSNEISSQE
jgi:hypothetical protein